MNLWRTTLICLFMDGIFLSALRLSNYVSNFQFATIRISNGAESPSLANAKSNSFKSWPSIRVRFRSFGQKFDFIATEIKDYHPSIVENVGFKETKTGDWTPTFYETQSHPNNPVSALGYLQDKILVGFAIVGNITYFLEPPFWYFPESDRNSTIIVYRNLDLITSSNPTFDQNLFSRIKSNLPTSGRLIKRSKNNLKDELICKIEIVADNSLFRRMGNNVEHTRALLYLHVKFADRVFRTTDFGTPTVRIVPDKVVMFTSPQNSNFSDSPIDASEFLRYFSYRSQDACLSMCISDRMFKKNTLGYSYVGSSTLPGGICQSKGMIDGKFIRRYNTGVLSLRAPTNEKVPLSTSMLAFTHELGHAFGSNNDPRDDLICSPYKHNGYLMYFEVPTKITNISTKFSPCSIKNMSRIIRKYGDCMKTTAPVICGNSVREGEEECDCGESESTCKLIDPCCTPKGGLGNDTECTFRRSLGNDCSPFENLCCETNCRIVVEKRQCSFDHERCLSSFCDGKSKDCPVPSPSEDGTPCMFTSKTCFWGSCNSTVCVDNKLEDCICAGKEVACHICCRKSKEEKCLPASEFGFRTPDGSKHKREPNTPCGKNEAETRCDMFGKCSSFPLPSSEQTNVFWIVLIVVCGLLIIVIISVVVGIQIAVNRRKRSSVVPPPN